MAFLIIFVRLLLEKVDDTEMESFGTIPDWRDWFCDKSFSYSKKYRMLIISDTMSSEKRNENSYRIHRRMALFFHPLKVLLYNDFSDEVIKYKTLS